MSTVNVCSPARAWIRRCGDSRFNRDIGCLTVVAERNDTPEELLVRTLAAIGPVNVGKCESHVEIEEIGYTDFSYIGL
jgi:hypothetical protein